MIWPAVVVLAPVTAMMFVADGATAVPRPVPAAENVTAELPFRVRLESVRVCLLPPPDT